jgi:hypothetical protein
LAASRPQSTAWLAASGSPSGCSGPSPASRPTTAFRRSCCSRAGQHTRDATTRARPFSGLQTGRAARVKREQCEWRRRESGWLGGVSYQRGGPALVSMPPWDNPTSSTTRLDYSTTRLLHDRALLVLAILSSPRHLSLSASRFSPSLLRSTAAIHSRSPITPSPSPITRGLQAPLRPRGAEDVHLRHREPLQPRARLHHHRPQHLHRPVHPDLRLPLRRARPPPSSAARELGGKEHPAGHEQEQEQPAQTPLPWPRPSSRSSRPSSTTTPP